MKSFFEGTEEDWVEHDISAELEEEQCKYDREHKDSITITVVEE